ncbi:MAG: repeat-containing protein [Phycisphaerales bacterium]|nr:repeat-containing protein [Phycisphaerales bacterium]
MRVNGRVMSVLLLSSAISAAAPTSAPADAELEGLCDTLLNPKNSSPIEKSLDRLRELGPAAEAVVPRFIAAVDPKKEADQDKRIVAIKALGAIGTPSVVPTLTRLLALSWAEQDAMRSFLELGEVAVEPFENAAMAQPERDRTSLLGSLRALGGPKALAAVARLQKKLTLPQNVEVANNMAIDLRGHAPEVMIPAVRKGDFSSLDTADNTGFSGLESGLRMIGDKDASVRAKGAYVMETMLRTFDMQHRTRLLRPYLAAHKADIRRALADPKREVQELARKLAKMSSIDTASSAEALALSGPSAQVRLTAMQRLVTDKGAAAEPTLRKVLTKDADREVRETAARMILDLPPAGPRLEAALRGADVTLRDQAVFATIRQGEPGWKLLFTVAGELDFARMQLLISSGPDAEGMRVAMAVLDGDEPKLYLPATLVLGNGFTPSGSGQTRPSDKAIRNMGARLADKDPQKRAAVSKALMRMAAVASGPVLDLLKSDDPAVRRSAALTLASDDTMPFLKNLLPGTALQPLLAAANDADPQVRENVAIALTRILDCYELRRAFPDQPTPMHPELVAAPDAVRGPAIKQLFQMLDDVDAEVRGAVIWYLGRVTDGSNQLLAVQKHNDPSVVRYAEYQRQMMYLRDRAGNTPAMTVNDLIAMLKDPRQGSRAKADAVRSLSLYGKDAAAAIPLLAEQIKPANPTRLRTAAAEALGLVGQGSTAAAKALIGALDDPEPNVVGFTVRSIGQIGPAAKGALPRLLAIVNRPRQDFETSAEQSLRTAALKALSGLGPDSVRGLIALLERGDPGSIYSASEQLRALGPDAAPAVPALIKTLQQDIPPRLAAMVSEALGAIGPAAADAVPAIIAHWQAATLMDRPTLAKALGDIGPAAATPEVIKALTGPGHYGRPEGDYNRALVKMGPAAIAAAPTLIAQVQSRIDARAKEKPMPGGGFLNNFDDAEQQAIVALGRMGPKAKAALPVLERALKTMKVSSPVGQMEILSQAKARIEGMEAIDTRTNWGPPSPPEPRGPREEPYDPNRDNRPPDLGGPFGTQEPHSP